MIDKKTTIGFYGIGNLGYAMLRNFDFHNQGQFNFIAYDLDSEVVEHLAKHRSHPTTHPDVKLSDNTQFTQSPEELLQKSQVVILSIPSTANRPVAKLFRQLAKDNLTIINTSKSLETSSGKRMSEIFHEELQVVNYTYALLAGGMIDRDVFSLNPLGADLACTDKTALDELQKLFTNTSLHVMPTTDLLGVEYASALKNVISILTGITHGLGLPYGSETLVISRTAEAIARACSSSLGADYATFSIARQCWGNDMFMSATGGTRNRAFGELLGQRTPVNDALAKMVKQDKLVEGVNTLQAIQHIPGLLDVEPIHLLSQLITHQTIDVNAIEKYIKNK